MRILNTAKTLWQCVVNVENGSIKDVRKYQLKSFVTMILLDFGVAVNLLTK